MREVRIERDGVKLILRSDWIFFRFDSDFLKIEINEATFSDVNEHWYFLNSGASSIAISKEIDENLRICSDNFEILLKIQENEKTELKKLFEETENEAEKEIKDIRKCLSKISRQFF